jgi:putative glutamine amidotransferase
MKSAGNSPKATNMRPRIAMPELCSYDLEYSNRALPAYLSAVEAAGGEPIVIPLARSPEEIAKAITGCSAILLPGSKADVDPQKYDALKHPRTSPADHLRDAADELLLQDAYNLRKPVFGICYGLQSLNVWRSGTLVQHIQSQINHSAGAKVEVAHGVRIEPDSLLAAAAGESEHFIPVNSSHHQSAATVGDGLRVVARCPEDEVIEAIEGTQPGHYVMAVQCHPERGFERDAFSANLFRALVKAAEQWRAQPK